MGIIRKYIKKDEEGNTIYYLFNKDGSILFEDNKPIFLIKEKDSYKKYSYDTNLFNLDYQLNNKHITKEVEIIAYFQIKIDKEGKIIYDKGQLIEEIIPVTADYDELVSAAKKIFSFDQNDRIETDLQIKWYEKLSKGEDINPIDLMADLIAQNEITGIYRNLYPNYYENEGMMNESDRAGKIVQKNATFGATNHGPEVYNPFPEELSDGKYIAFIPTERISILNNYQEIANFIEDQEKKKYPLDINPIWSFKYVEPVKLDSKEKISNFIAKQKEKGISLAITPLQELKNEAPMILYNEEDIYDFIERKEEGHPISLVGFDKVINVILDSKEKIADFISKQKEQGFALADIPLRGWRMETPIILENEQEIIDFINAKRKIGYPFDVNPLWGWEIDNNGILYIPKEKLNWQKAKGNLLDLEEKIDFIKKSSNKTQNDLKEIYRLEDLVKKHGTIINLIKDLKKRELSPDLIYTKNEHIKKSNDFRDILINKVKEIVKQNKTNDIKSYQNSCKTHIAKYEELIDGKFPIQITMEPEKGKEKSESIEPNTSKTR